MISKHLRHLPSERIFVSTASIVPLERRGSGRGGYQNLRKPKRDPNDPAERMAYDQLRFGPRDPVASQQAHAPASAQQGAGEGREGERQHGGGGGEGVKWRYDPMLHAWFEVQRPQTASASFGSPPAGPLSIANFVQATPRGRTSGGSRAPGGGGESRGSSPRKGLNVRFNEEKLAQAQDENEGSWPSQREWVPPAPKGVASPPKGGVAFASQMDTQCDWEAFRSPKPPAFDEGGPDFTVIKDAIGREVSFLKTKTPENSMIAVNALYHTIAPFVEAERPLSGRSPRAKRKTLAKAPPAKGRRNCSSHDFLGSMSHDFVPVPDEDGQQPSLDGMTYSIWSPATHLEGVNVKHITSTGLQRLPTKKYGGGMHPGLYEEEVIPFRGPEDRGRLLKANSNVLGMVANYQPRF